MTFTDTFDMFACPVCMPSTFTSTSYLCLTRCCLVPFLVSFYRTTAVTVTLLGKLEISTFYEPAKKTSKVSGHEF